eukprot:190157_1
MSLSLKIKTTNGRIIETVADPDLTIYDLKAICCDELKTQPENQTLLFKGKVCDDDETLESIKITNNSCLIVLLKKKKKMSQESKQELKQESKQEEEKQTQQIPQIQMKNMPNMQNIQQSLMQNPSLLSKMMDNPMINSMFNNPEILQNIFSSSPALQQLLNDNPQLRHVLRDPSLMKHAMRAASNPEYYNEMLKNNDRALRNIESIPGGFSALSRLYNQIQRPMERAMDDMYRQRFGKSNTKITEMNNIDKSNGPINKPMENPWCEEYYKKKQLQQQKQQQKQQKQQQTNMFNINNVMNMMNLMNIKQNASQIQNNNNNNQNENPSQIYVIQLQQLRNMGFNDEQRNINALIRTGGNVNAAIQHLIGQPSNDNTKNDENNSNKK